MYNGGNQAPFGKIDFDEFATVSLDRFSVLQLFENIGSRHMKGSEKYLTKLDEELRKVGFIKSILCSTKDSVEEADINKDILSHFILRLAFCKTDELKRWFIQHEVDLFRYKLSRVSNDAVLIERFLRDNNMVYSPISESEKNEIREQLIEMGQTSATQLSHTSFYKIHFLEVLELVKSRRVFVKGGYAYLTIGEFGSVLTHLFRAHLSKHLTTLGRHIGEIEQDERIADLLKILRERDVGGDKYDATQAKDHLTVECLDLLVTKAMPLCMRHLHESLRTEHHLKHYGRLQYLLFLKGAGLPLEENLRLFRTEFSQSRGVEKFEKEYAYNIRHSYGQEGKRVSYTPYSCLKIITSQQPTNSDRHGCPFKHFERQFLKQKLKSYGRTDTETSQIMEQSDSGNYQIACQRYFEMSHKTEEFVVINHPNSYFEQSQRLTQSGSTRRIKTEPIKIEMTQ